jgi:hypothetical protein
LQDVDGLEVEATYDRGSPEAIRANLAKNGATPQEIEFLLNNRVELNALTSDSLVALIERKLVANGVHKIVPSNTKLAEVYQAFVRGERVREIVDAELERVVDIAPVSTRAFARTWTSTRPTRGMTPSPR